MAEAKIGAYICKGCGIGERLNTEQLALIATREGKAALCREHEFLCSDAGIAMIREDLANEGVERIAIGACSRRAKAEAFNFDEVPVARANLREGVIWARPDTEEARESTQEMAADYIRMACGELKHTAAAEPSQQQSLNRNILVVGGGVSGLTAALEASRAGYAVTLVEKSGALGGAAARLHRRIPTRAPYAEPADTGIADLIAEVQAAPNITVYLNATTTRTSGAPGRFAADITTESGSTRTDQFGAIIQASGFKPYDARRLTEFAYGELADVVTQMDLERLAADADGAPIKRPSDGKEVQSVLFIQCAGQRSDREGHLPYCSGFCCSSSIKQAMYFKDINPKIDTTVLYTDLRTPGTGGEDFYRSGQRKGVIFTKGTASAVTRGNDGPLVRFRDLILDEEVETPVDLVVLATGLVPNAGVDIEAEPSAQADPTAATVSVDSILNLDYRQGKDIPQLANGFADSHFICFPYESRRTGIYAAGPVRRPMDILQAREDAMGAAMKAIQSIENASLGRGVHPRVGDLSFPSFRKEGCTQCKRCTVECPFGAIDEDENRYPQFNESRCRRCGTCMGACPVRVISFRNYSIDTVGQQIKAVEIPEEMEEKPRILVLACQNDAYPALDMATQNGIHYSPYVRIVPIRCLGSVSISWVTDSMNSGYDGVILMGCPSGDNYQCHFVRGSAMAQERMRKIGDTLQTLNLEPERVATYEVSITDIQRAPQLIEDMVATVDKIGLSPFKF